MYRMLHVCTLYYIVHVHTCTNNVHTCNSIITSTLSTVTVVLHEHTCTCTCNIVYTCTCQTWHEHKCACALLQCLKVLLSIFMVKVLVLTCMLEYFLLAHSLNYISD